MRPALEGESHLFERSFKSSAGEKFLLLKEKILEIHKSGWQHVFDLMTAAIQHQLLAVIRTPTEQENVVEGL